MTYRPHHEDSLLLKTFGLVVAFHKLTLVIFSRLFLVVSIGNAKS